MTSPNGGTLHTLIGSDTTVTRLDNAADDIRGRKVKDKNRKDFGNPADGNPDKSGLAHAVRAALRR